MTNSNRDENIVWTIVRIIIGLIAVIFVSAIFISIPGYTDELHANFRPFKVWDFIGVVMFLAGAFHFTGLYDVQEKINDKRQAKGKKDLPGYVFKVGIAALIIIGWALTIV